MVFPYIGYLSKLTGLNINTVIQDGILNCKYFIAINMFIIKLLLGTGLVFVVMPFAVAQLNGSVFWSIIFFVMLFSVGLDTMMATVENTVTAVVDIFPVLKVKKKREYYTTLAVCTVYFSIGLIFCSQNGIYWVHLFDNYSSGLYC